jgi:hypothetical protein
MPVFADDGVGEYDQLSGDCDERDLLGLALLDEAFVKSFEAGIKPGCDQRCHVQGVPGDTSSGSYSPLSNLDL